MKFVNALAFLVAVTAHPFEDTAHANYLRRLVQDAVPTKNSQIRHLANNYVPDITNYAVTFEQCQFVKSYDDTLAETSGASTVLATQRFAVFRLCPYDSCSSCNYNYGEYLIDLYTYLKTTVTYFQDWQTNMCTLCQTCIAANDTSVKGVDCSSCTDECYKIANMQTNGYIDATDFLACQLVYDPSDDTKSPLYAGPICASGGSKIKIGVFTDSSCLNLDVTKDIDDYLMNNNGQQMKLSHALLKMTYQDTCISCNSSNSKFENYNAANDGSKVIDTCETLYAAAAKCEKTHGFDDGSSGYYGYENQLAEESVVCDFLQSLKSGTYDDSGEIVVTGSASSIAGGKATTGGQKFALTFFILGTVGLAVYAAMLHSKLTKGAKVDLSSTGGAMA